MDEKITGFIEVHKGFAVFTTSRIVFIKNKFLGNFHFDTMELYRKLSNNLLTVPQLESQTKKLVILKKDVRNIQFKKGNFLTDDQIIIDADKIYTFRIMEADFNKFKLHIENKIEPISVSSVETSIKETKKYFTSFIGQIGNLFLLTGIGLLLNFLKEDDPIRKWSWLVFSVCLGFIGWYIYHKRNKWL
jgi:hypothetical protein